MIVTISVLGLRSWWWRCCLIHRWSRWLCLLWTYCARLDTAFLTFKKKGNFVSVLFWNIRRREHSSTLWLVFPVICWSLSELEIWNSLIEKKPFNASKERCQGANSEWNFCVILAGQNLTHFFLQRGEMKKQWFGGQPANWSRRAQIYFFYQCWNFARKNGSVLLDCRMEIPKKVLFSSRLKRGKLRHKYT